MPTVDRTECDVRENWSKKIHKLYLTIYTFIFIFFLEGIVGRMGGEERCVEGFGGETCGKQTTWKSQA